MNTFGWLVEKSSQITHYSYLRDLFKPFPELLVKHDWLFSGIECNYYPAMVPTQKDFILSGTELMRIYKSEEQPQFIWGVLSSLSPSESFDLEKNEIYAEDNVDLWTKDVKMQHEGSLIEIVAWDSSLFIYLTTDSELLGTIKASYPEGKDLATWNQEADDRRRNEK